MYIAVIMLCIVVTCFWMVRGKKGEGFARPRVVFVFGLIMLVYGVVALRFIAIHDWQRAVLFLASAVFFGAFAYENWRKLGYKRLSELLKDVFA